MKTEIFANLDAFLARKDKMTNGVSQYFADMHPNYKTDNKKNKGCWNCNHCNYCDYCSDCTTCTDCTECYECHKCYDCRGCTDCYYGIDFVNEQHEYNYPGFVPKIDNIHQELLRTLEQPENTLNMKDWHICMTAHCRAGWIVVIAGEEGRKLEMQTTTEFAATLIYRASSDIRVPRDTFYADDDTAMADIRDCAAMERAR